MASIKRSIITHESLSKKILADDGTQYMACCCAPTPTPTPTATPTPTIEPTPTPTPLCCGGRSIDVTFNNITDCGQASTVDCTESHGITTAVGYYGSGGSLLGADCEWYAAQAIPPANVSSILLGLSDNGDGTWRLDIELRRYYAADRYILCFSYSGNVTAGCDQFPHNNIPNDFGAGDCSGYSGVEGYDGTCDVDWT